MQAIVDLIKEFFKGQDKAYDILMMHSRLVADYALEIAAKNPALSIDLRFLEEGALIHDIGMIATDAPDLGCYGQHTYLEHGVIGREMLEKKAMPKHALVCERHIGVGITKDEIIEHAFPLPPRDMLPLSMEEKLICYADKFFSKSSENKSPKSYEKVRKKIAKYGVHSLERFDELHRLFTAGI